MKEGTRSGWRPVYLAGAALVALLAALVFSGLAGCGGDGPTPTAQEVQRRAVEWLADSPFEIKQDTEISRYSPGGHVSRVEEGEKRPESPLVPIPHVLDGDTLYVSSEGMPGVQAPWVALSVSDTEDLLGSREQWSEAELQGMLFPVVSLLAARAFDPVRALQQMTPSGPPKALEGADRWEIQGTVSAATLAGDDVAALLNELVGKYPPGTPADQLPSMPSFEVRVVAEIQPDGRPVIREFDALPQGQSASAAQSLGRSLVPERVQEDPQVPTDTVPFSEIFDQIASGSAGTAPTPGASSPGTTGAPESPATTAAPGPGTTG